MIGARLVFAGALLAMAAAVPLSAAVDPELLEMVPPDTRLLIGVQVQQTLSSPFGHFMLSQMPDQSAVLLQLAATTGFDLRRDLREVLLASDGRRGKLLRDGVLLARGAFQMDRLILFAGKVHAIQSSYAGVPLIRPADDGASSVAILDASTLAVGSEANLKGVINRRAQRFLFSGALADKARLASADAHAWAATVTPIASLFPSPADGRRPVALLQAILESSAGLRFDTSGVTLSAEALTHSEQEASALSGMFKIVTGLLKGAEASILQNARFTTEGAVTRISLTVAEQDLEQAFPAPVQKRAAR
jgi:hypothetical protein